MSIQDNGQRGGRRVEITRGELAIHRAIERASRNAVQAGTYIPTMPDLLSELELVRLRNGEAPLIPSVLDPEPVPVEIPVVGDTVLGYGLVGAVCAAMGVVVGWLL